MSAAGVTRTEQRLATIENGSPFDTSANARRRLVVVADNDSAARATLAAIRWFKTTAPRSLRDRWAISAVLLSHANDATPAQRLEFPPAKGFFDHPEQPESRYLWRWVAYQAPDVLLQIRGGDVLSRSTPPAGSLAAAMAGGSEMGTVQSVFGSARETDGPALFEHVLKDAAATRQSEIRATLRARAVARAPGDCQSRSPPSIHRIHSSATSHRWPGPTRFVCADITKDNALRQKVLNETRPWLSRERPLFGERVALTAAAGTLIYADLALRGEESARPLAIAGR